MNELRSTITCKDDDDEWYDRSIVDYRELIMFEVENKPLLLSVGDQDNIYLLEEKTQNVQVLSLHTLPDKIVEARHEEVVKSSHLNIQAGTFLDAEIIEMQALYGQRRLIASEVASPGLSSFRANSDTDKIVKDSKRLASSSLVAPHFAQIDGETIILTKTTSDSAFSLNMMSESLHQLKLDELSLSSSSSNLIPFGISSHSVGLGIEDTGYAVIYDLRSHSPVITIQGNSSPSKWFFAASYKPISPYTGSTLVAMLSDSGSAAIFDLKSPLQPLTTGKIPQSPTKMRMSPSGKLLSVSDTLGLVKLYSISSSEFTETFCHEGHVRMEHCDRLAKTTDHCWYSDSTIISAADNKTVNIWQFNVSS
uniref:WD repeat-containing protein 73 n=2 Tax=Lygus hesperus TaxID=30085 RepID=A0A0A9YEG6_LYGHE